jgi:hypothetical protein
MRRFGRERDSSRNLLIKCAAVIGIAACLGDLLMTHLLGNRYPGYNSNLQSMSELGEGSSPVAGIASAWWIIMGVMFIFFGYGFHRAFQQFGKTARAAGWMLALYGIGEGLGSGLIAGTPGKAFRTPGSIFHNLVGGVGMLAAILLPLLVLSIYRARRSPVMYWYSWITTAAGIFFLILFGVSSFYHPSGSWISYAGLWQRLCMLTYYLFFICLAVLMLRWKNIVPDNGGK